MIPIETALMINAITTTIAIAISLVIGVHAGRKAAFREALGHYDAAVEQQKGIREGKPAAQYRGQLRGRR